MKISDKEVLKLLKKVRSYQLEESIESYPENERDGRTDLEFFADELSYHISCFHEDGHDWKDDLVEARQKLRRTKNGKVIPINPSTMNPQHGYWESDIQRARDLVNEYNRLYRLLKKVQNMGVYGSWFKA